MVWALHLCRAVYAMDMKPGIIKYSHAHEGGLSRIGVIAFYAKQVNLIREHFREQLRMRSDEDCDENCDEDCGWLPWLGRGRSF